MPILKYCFGIYVVSTGFFGVDIFLQFRTTNGSTTWSVAGNGKETCLQYLFSLFAFDLVCTLPIAFVFVLLGPRGFLAGATLRLLRILRVHRLLTWSDPLKQMPAHMFLQKFGFYLLLAIHNARVRVHRRVAVHAPALG